MTRQLTSRKAAAVFLSLSERSIDRKIRDGYIEAFKPTGSSRVLIFKDSLTQENLQSPKPKFI